MKRRDFLRATGGIALFNVLPRRLVAGSGAPPPSETVCVAAIGAGGRAGADINGLAGAGARIVGLCDVDDRRSGGMARSSRRRRTSNTTARCSTGSTRRSTP